MKYKAAIIGLYYIGPLFDEYPKRSLAGSHVGAYPASPDVEIANAQTDKLERFTRRCLDTRPYRDNRGVAGITD